jgi:hypothetical protein
MSAASTQPSRQLTSVPISFQDYRPSAQTFSAFSQFCVLRAAGYVYCLRCLLPVCQLCRAEGTRRAGRTPRHGYVAHIRQGFHVPVSEPGQSLPPMCQRGVGISRAECHGDIAMPQRPSRSRDRRESQRIWSRTRFGGGIVRGASAAHDHFSATSPSGEAAKGSRSIGLCALCVLCGCPSLFELRARRAGTEAGRTVEMHRRRSYAVVVIRSA